MVIGRRINNILHLNIHYFWSAFKSMHLKNKTAVSYFTVPLCNYLKCSLKEGVLCSRIIRNTDNLLSNDQLYISYLFVCFSISKI